MFRNPKIIILDEATSSLDFESECVVQAALDTLAENKTTIVISHRYRALLNTNKILVLHDGEQVGFDHHDKLMAENKFFSDMFAGQKEVMV
jgi:ABC-type multidrug transport system fused ATPase/permease subunit